MCGPPPSAASTSSAASRSWRYWIATVAPAPANSTAAARPIPREPPVTSTTTPSKAMEISMSARCGVERSGTWERSPVPDVDEDRPLPALAERYELGNVLGAGAAATVYRAVDRHSGRSVAVKLFDPQVSRPRRPGHVVEAAALGELRHPALVELYATGVDNGLAYLVMQLVDG